MSNPANFTGLENRQYVNSLKPFIKAHLPVMNEALRRNIGTWRVEGSRFVFRFSPRAYSRLNTLLSFYKKEQGLRSYNEIAFLLEEQSNAIQRGEQVQLVSLTELEFLLAMLYEAEALRTLLKGKTDTLQSHSTNWDDDFYEEEEEEAEAPAEGLSVYTQDWYTYSKKGKKLSQEGLEIVLQAHAAHEEASVKAAGGWNA